MLRKQHSQATPVHLDVGNTIMKRAPDRPCKLTPKFSCPCLVTVKLHCSKFKPLNYNTNNSEVVHIDRLKKVSTSFTLAAVPSPPFSTSLPSPPDARPSYDYRLRSVDQFPPHPFLFSLARIEAKLAPPCIFLCVFFFGCPPWAHILF